MLRLVACTLLVVACTAMEAPTRAPLPEPVVREGTVQVRWKWEPIEGAAYVAPWEQVEEVCFARPTDREDTGHDCGIEDDCRTESGITWVLEVLRGCLAEYGWQLLPRYTEPEDDP